MRATRDFVDRDGPGQAGQGVKALNALSRSDARGALLACCSVPEWADAMVAARPFADAERLLTAADATWRALGPDGWRHAFAGHPRIGGGHPAAGAASAATTTNGRATQWSASEQSAASSASDEMKAELARANIEYELRFGHIYLVCANGRSAAELLADATARMQNDPETELRVAAEEQRRITRLRLTRLLEEGVR